jgi:M6 family metalloprotease-like protein
MKDSNGILILLFLILLSPALLSGGPLRFIPQKLIQPNGDTVKCFASGNEHYHWLHDKNGYTIVFNTVTKYWVYAEKKGAELVPSDLIAGKDNPSGLTVEKWLKPDNSVLRARIEAKASLQNKNKSTAAALSNNTKGTINNIVIFIRFRDQQEFSKPLSHYQNMFNGTADTSISLKSYYYSVSYNQLTINSSLFPASDVSTVVSYKDLHERDYYRDESIVGDSGYADTDKGYQRLSAMLKRATTYISSQVSASLNIDANSDGNIDNVVYILEGAVDGWDDVLWPFQDTADFNVSINSKKVATYNLQLDDELSASVLCHEMFHSLGAPDLYHYNNYSVPVGPWDLMEDDANQNMTAYMKYKYGKWISLPAAIAQSGTYTLKPLGGTDTTNICYKIASPNSTTEYFMLEYRNKTLKYETELPASGVIIYRINTRYSGKGNEDGPPDELYIYRPGGTTSDDGTIDDAAFSQLFNRTSFSSSTNPSCFLNSGASGGISISNISVNSATASFTYNSGSVDVETINEIPKEFSLAQNYPNPFNPGTTISYKISKAGNVLIRVYDLLGRVITTLVDENKSAGSYSVIFNASNLTSGLYIYRIAAGSYNESKKMLLLK